MKKLLLIAALFFCFKAHSTTYYPTSITQANSMGKIGDSIVFKTGTYTGVLNPKSGVNYYGINATIYNPNSPNEASVYFYNVFNVSFEGFTISDGNHYAVFVDGGQGNTIKNCHFFNVGIGVEFTGQRNKLLSCYIHDTKMIVNTPGGNDDYGANGVVLSNSNNSVIGNTFVNCKAPSYDFGFDGGAVEVFGDVFDVDSSIITNNTVISCEGFAEFGSRNKMINGIMTSRHCIGTIITGNVLNNNGRGFWVNTSGSFKIAFSGYNISGNTFIEAIKGNYSNLSNVPIGKNSYSITTGLIY